MTAVYAFKDSARLQAGHKADPQIVGEHLETLRQHHGGRLSSHALVDDASLNNSPLHPLFEWNNGAAAHQYRLWQARKLIGAVTVRYNKAPEAEPIRAFVNIKSGDQPQAYTSTKDALEDPSLRAQVLNDALRELDRFRRKYADLEELATVFKAAGKVRSQIEKAA